MADQVTKKRTRSLGDIWIEKWIEGSGTWTRSGPKDTDGQSSMADTRSAEMWISDNAKNGERYRVIREVGVYDVKATTKAVRL